MVLIHSPKTDGVLRASLYAFSPNRLHFCGPAKNQEMLDYIDRRDADPGLAYLLKRFETMFPYFNTIASANRIRDPFDERVVEAYWLGNHLLEQITASKAYRFLEDELQLKKKLKRGALEKIGAKLSEGARLTHSFHVFNIGKRTGKADSWHTIETMDACRISWGKITAIDGPFLTIEREPLVFIGNKLGLGQKTVKRIVRRLYEDDILENVKIGDTVSIHWDLPCEILNERQLKNLKHFTNLSIKLFNQAQ